MNNAEMEADSELIALIENLRRQAAVRMELGEVSGKVLPTVVLLAPPAQGGQISSRYFVSRNCHAAHAVTGALCVATACHIPGTLAQRLVQLNAAAPQHVTIEHSSGAEW